MCCNYFLYKRKVLHFDLGKLYLFFFFPIKYYNFMENKCVFTSKYFQIILKNLYLSKKDIFTLKKK